MANKFIIMDAGITADIEYYTGPKLSREEIEKLPATATIEMEVRKETIKITFLQKSYKAEALVLNFYNVNKLLNALLELQDLKETITSEQYYD